MGQKMDTQDGSRGPYIDGCREIEITSMELASIRLHCRLNDSSRDSSCSHAKCVSQDWTRKHRNRTVLWSCIQYSLSWTSYIHTENMPLTSFTRQQYCPSVTTPPWCVGAFVERRRANSCSIVGRGNLISREHQVVFTKEESLKLLVAALILAGV